MKKWLIVFASIAILVSCTGKSSKKNFEVSGTITNGANKIIYLERQRIKKTSGKIYKPDKWMKKEIFVVIGNPGNFIQGLRGWFSFSQGP